MRSLALRTGIAVVALACVGTFFLAATVRSSRLPHNFITGHAREKLIETIPPVFNEPVNIVGVIAGQKEINFGEKFTSDKDWLRGAKFRLKNITKKKIVFIELDVDFPETRASGAETSYRINLGQIPNIHHSAVPLAVLPSGELEADIDDKRYSNMVKLIQERHSLSDISKAHVQVGFVVFEDGTAWSAGTFYRQDTSNPKRWIPLN
jgi:hypothetical protein